MSSVNKIIIPLNSTFSLDAFFSVLLKRVNPPWLPKGRKLPSETLVLEGQLKMLKMVESGIPSAFQHEVVGPEYSGDMSESMWYSVVDLSMNPGLSEALTLCPRPSIRWYHLETRDT